MPAIHNSAIARLVVPIAGAVLVGACGGGTATSTAGEASPTATTPAATTVATATTTSSGPLTADELVWLQGIGSLGKKMTKAVTEGPSNMTEASMRSVADKLRACSPELAKLGASTDRLQPVNELAKQGCVKYAEAARCFAKAASIQVVGSGSFEKAKKQVDCAAAASNKGGGLLADAEEKSFEIQTASQ